MARCKFIKNARLSAAVQPARMSRVFTGCTRYHVGNAVLWIIFLDWKAPFPIEVVSCWFLLLLCFREIPAFNAFCGVCSRSTLLVSIIFMEH